MESFFRRRRRLLIGVAAGAAGALAAYYWYTGYAKNKIEQQRSVEAELTAILRGESQGGAADAADGEDAEDGDGDECGSPDLDESLDSHFNYIQKVSAPQELTTLLPRVQETLFRLTDVTLVKQLQLQQQQQPVAAGGAAGAASSAQQQLRLLARLCFGRTVAAVFLLPLMDLGVRTKLNVIGRHLFLQEKFSKLRQPAAPAARMRLPPRLTAAAVEAFLSCEQLAGAGTAWLVEQAMAAAELVLDGTALDAQVTPEELAALVQDMASRLGQAVTAAAATSATGSAWVEVLVGPGGAAPAPPAVDAAAAAGSAEAYRRALASAAMVEELTTELRRVLCNYRFGEALHAAVGQCLSTCAAHIHATFISQAAAAVAVAQPARPQPAPAAGSAPAPAAAPEAPSPASAAAAAHELPKQAVVSPFSAAASGAESGAEATAAPAGAGDSTEGPAPAAAQPPMPAPFGAALEATAASTSPEGEAGSGTEAGAGSSTAFASAVSTAANSASNSSASIAQTQLSSSSSSSQQQQPQPLQQKQGQQGPAEAGQAAAPAPQPPASPAAVPADRSSSGGGSCASSGGSASSSTGGAGAIGRKASLAAAAVAAMQPRPLARCLRAVQGACDPLFVDAREVTARIACLPPVMSLCAVAFAAPLEL
ncbi:hypothetical protein HXX76_013434 [Chlamydomonas incerta]|uniref:Peroxin-3 n=1 Tax=Chlamydomonas incerta TaxID=51695 RepID=A0A835SPB8_CHLIN|nr:hypothetical protein HXX76_013434 [Chlamydomonas incerta]|eukprot:KAG2425809.1 hypothetical protein HXX76_013434 [Chlamydomonas incerta]